MTTTQLTEAFARHDCYARRVRIIQVVAMIVSSRLTMIGVAIFVAWFIG